MGSAVSSPQKRSPTPQLVTNVVFEYEGIPISNNNVHISHYLPPTFPIESVVTSMTLEKCTKTWNLISLGAAQGMGNTIGKSGVVLMYDEFFFRLFKRAKIFEDIFPSVQKRAEVMLKGIEFILGLTGNDSPQEQKRLFFLGRAHRFKQSLRPWMFSVYAETFLETLMFWLGSDANSSIGEAWTNLYAYALRRILTAYLVNRVIENEFYQNSDIEAIRKINAQSNYSQSKKGNSETGSIAEGPHEEMSTSY